MVRTGGLRALGASAIVAILISGCAANNTAGPASGFAGASDCKSAKAEMNKLIGQGVIGQIEAQQNGRNLKPRAQAQVSRYNQLLEVYLGGKCHQV